MSGMVPLKALVSHRAVVLLVGVGTGAMQLAQEGRMKAGAGGTALTWRWVGLDMWLLPHRPCPHLCPSSTCKLFLIEIF